MASIVEVTTKQAPIQDLTLKISRTEASDLRLFITEWYNRNYSYRADTQMKANGVYQELTKALDGKVDQSLVKIKSELAVF